MRNANAKRALALVRTQRHLDSEEHLTSLAYLVDMSHETIVDYIIAAKIGERTADAERFVLSQEEWKDMTSYMDAARQFAAMTPEQLAADPDWESFSAKEEQYSREVAKRTMEIEDAERDVLQRLPREKLEEQALKKRAEFVGSQAYLGEYQRWMNYYSVREFENKDLTFFAHVDEWAAAPEPVKEICAEALEPFISDGSEAKNSSRAEAGSDSSEPPVTQEISESSIPLEQSA